jgi:hypothetical protein
MGRLHQQTDLKKEYIITGNTKILTKQEIHELGLLPSCRKNIFSLWHSMRKQMENLTLYRL